MEDFKVYKATIWDVPRICSFLKVLKEELLDPNLQITDSKSYAHVFGELLRITLFNSLQKKIIGYSSQIIIADSSKKVVGIAYVGVRNKIATLHGLFVSKNNRNKGVGTKLLLDILLFCKRQNVRVVQLYVSAHNEAAISLYQKMGFSVAPYEVANVDYEKLRTRMEIVFEVSFGARVVEKNLLKLASLKLLSETA